jgi:cytochrome c oxidase assembly protein subunit 15
MSSIAAINLDPALSVAGVGAVLAALMGLTVAWRARRQGLQGLAAWQHALTVLALFLTLDLLVFGAFTRLTDSGLGCPDWPGCYGESNPWAAHSAIREAHVALPSGPVSPTKAWIEMLHRYLATGVGALLTGLMVMAWWGRGKPGMSSPLWPTAAFLWVCGQGAFGAMTVALKLQPIVVTGHLLGAMLGVGILTWQVRRMQAMPRDAAQAGRAANASVLNPSMAMSAKRRHNVRLGSAALLILLTVQLALGAWVSSNYAVLACAEFPTCQGQWWPQMDWPSAFHLMRELGQDGQGGYISLAALTAIHMAHRLMAVVVVTALVWWGAVLRRHPDTHPEGHWLWGLTAWQLASGLSNVVLGWPLLAALAHTLGAALLVWRLVGLLALPAGHARAHASAWSAEASPPASSPTHLGAASLRHVNPSSLASTTGAPS